MHLIVSLAAPEPEVRCYRIQEGMCTAIDLTVVGPPVRWEGHFVQGFILREDCCRLVVERMGSSRAKGS